MGYRFEAQECQTITAAEKVSRCLLMAEETQALADDATPELAESYMRMSDLWLKLAGDIERASTLGADHHERLPQFRCRCCRKSEREVLQFIEMAGFIFCDECISAAAQIIGQHKTRLRA